jgi:hypothetical protein
MKKAIFFLACLVLAAVARAQESRWSYKDRDEFVSNCVSTASEGMSIDSAKYYCYCMLATLEKEFPDPADVASISQADLSTPEWKAKVQACLGLAWPAWFREKFMKDCIGSAKEHLGESDAISYCDCMSFKIQLIYPNHLEADKLPAEVFESPEMQRLIRSCIPPKRD